jgi:signal transduction histidine kinase
LPGIVELCRAVSEKLELERQLAERERLALVGQMTASISHNLKNPLGSMKTVLQVQLENPGIEESVRRDLQMVLSELDRLSGKLNALLRYARPAVRGGEASIQIEIERVAKEVTMLLDHEAKRRGITVELHEAAKCGCLQGSEDALSDIFSNLIVNAMEAVAAGGRVDVKLRGDDVHVEIVVADDGPGISAEQQARLFQPFFTTKANGTGLGLAIVRRRATELGGTVICRSPIADGHGAEFIVRLPRMAC